MGINRKYFDYGESLVRHDFKKAKFYLNQYLKEEKNEIADFEIAALYQWFGNVLFDSGDTKRALEKYFESIRIAPDCFLTKLKYAEFLATKIKDNELASSLLFEIIDECEARPFSETKYDFSSDYYLKAAKKILNDL